MALPRTSNYEIMKHRMSGEFVKYDQEKMIQKFALEADGQYLYLRFVDRDYRIHRGSGLVTWSQDHFRTETEGDYNEAMTIYDILCNSKEECRIAGTYCTTNALPGTVQTTGVGGSFFQRSANRMAGRVEQLVQALDRIGERIDWKGDVAARIPVFGELSVIVQFWDADEEFPATLKFMVDENIQDFMHFETVMFLLGHIAGRIETCMGEV